MLEHNLFQGGNVITRLFVSTLLALLVFSLLALPAAADPLRVDDIKRMATSDIAVSANSFCHRCEILFLFTLTSKTKIHLY